MNNIIFIANKNSINNISFLYLQQSKGLKVDEAELRKSFRIYRITNARRDAVLNEMLNGLYGYNNFIISSLLSVNHYQIKIMKGNFQSHYGIWI